MNWQNRQLQFDAYWMPVVWSRLLKHMCYRIWLPVLLCGNGCTEGQKIKLNHMSCFCICIKVYWARLVNPTIQVNSLKNKGVLSKQYIGADFLFLESQTSYICFWISRQALRSPKIAGRTNLAEEPLSNLSIVW